MKYSTLLVFASSVSMVAAFPWKESHKHHVHEKIRHEDSDTSEKMLISDDDDDDDSNAYDDTPNQGSQQSSDSHSSGQHSDSEPANIASGDISLNGVGSAVLKNAVSAYTHFSSEFRDGELDCSSFPSDYSGVLALDYLGFGGWSGIYDPDAKSNGNSCKDGSYCSYSCQPGMSKTQWPDDQPANGVSVGGLQCRDGKLYRTNTHTSNLCEWGVDAAIVVSELSDSVAICRTDYPGTENMVIPTVVQPGSTAALTTVDENNYYNWQGKKTSAQYYVNNAGVSQSQGCTWGQSGSGVGNWAPLNFGAGFINGNAFLSLIPNPNNNSPANFNVKIVPDGDSMLTGECRYENGAYIGGNGSDGCTVTVTKGKAKFVLYK